MSQDQYTIKGKLWYVPFYVSVNKAAKLLHVGTRTIVELINSSQLDFIETKSGKFKVKIEIGMSKEDALDLLGKCP